MPLLLRRSAPSPTIDQLAFAVPAAPLSASGASTGSTGTGASNLRSSAGSEAHLAQLQRCSTHARMSMARRPSGASSSNHTELAVCVLESCAGADCSDPLHTLRGSSGVTDTDAEDSGSSSGADDAAANPSANTTTRASSKRTGEQQAADDDDTATSEWGYGSEAGRASSAPSCACSCREDDACATASGVMIEDKQLAVVDRELRDLRKTFADKLYKRLSKMSLAFGRRRGSSTPQLTAA